MEPDSWLNDMSLGERGEEKGRKEQRKKIDGDD